MIPVLMKGMQPNCFCISVLNGAIDFPYEAFYRKYPDILYFSTICIVRYLTMECIDYPYVDETILKYTVLADGSCSVLDLVGNDSITNFRFPDEIDSRPVVHIANAALSALPNVHKIKIPVSVDLLGDFIGDPEERIVSVPMFSELLESIVVDKKNKTYCSDKGILYSKNMEVLYHCPRYNKWHGVKVGGKTKIIKSRAFAGCHYLDSVSILADVIEEKAFEGCKHLEEAMCDVSRIEDKAFADCENLKEVIIGNQLEYIGDYAFANCMNLFAVYTDTDRLQRMVTNSFFNCTSLKTISIPEGPNFISVEDVVFRKANPDDIFNENVPVGMYSLVLYPSKRKAEAYVLPLNAYAIEDGAFSNIFYDLCIYLPSYCVANIDLRDSTGPSNMGYLVGDVCNYPNWKIGVERHWIDV